MSKKRYYWIKLKEDFFDSVAIKRLRRLAGGDTYTIIYLRMQLLAMKNDGVIAFQGVDGAIASEIALMLDEEEDNVKVCLQFLESNGLAEITTNGDCFLPETIENTGSESDSAERVRKHRESQKALQCNTDVTKCNDDVTFALISLSNNSNTKLDSNTIKDSNTELDKKDIVNNIYNNIESDAEQFFAECWKAYPRKKGKGSVSKSQKKKLFCDVGLEQMLRCIDRYRKYVSGQEEKYIMYGSTFFNSGYVDYLDENYGEKNDLQKSNEPETHEEPKVGKWNAEWDDDEDDGLDEWMRKNGGK